MIQDFDQLRCKRFPPEEASCDGKNTRLLQRSSHGDEGDTHLTMNRYFATCHLILILRVEGKRFRRFPKTRKADDHA